MRVSVALVVVTTCVCVCVCVAAIRTDRTSVSVYEWLNSGSYFTDGSYPHSAAQSVRFRFHLERLWVD